MSLWTEYDRRFKLAVDRANWWIRLKSRLDIVLLLLILTC